MEANGLVKMIEVCVELQDGMLDIRGLSTACGAIRPWAVIVTGTMEMGFLRMNEWSG
jgi:hypothetical protein